MLLRPAQNFKWGNLTKILISCTIPPLDETPIKALFIIIRTSRAKRGNVMDVLGFILFGTLVGVYSSFLGLGGGLLIVPLMVALGFDPKIAVATSLFVIIPTASAGVVGAWVDINWRVALLLSAGAVVAGMPLGTVLKAYVSSGMVRKTFGVVLFITAIDMMGIWDVKTTLGNFFHLVSVSSAIKDAHSAGETLGVSPNDLLCKKEECARWTP